MNKINIGSPVVIWGAVILFFLFFFFSRSNKNVRHDFPDLSKDELAAHPFGAPYISTAPSVRVNPVYPTGPMMISRN